MAGVSEVPLPCVIRDTQTVSVPCRSFEVVLSSKSVVTLAKSRFQESEGGRSTTLLRYKGAKGFVQEVY